MSISNREISRTFLLYAELLQVHSIDDRLPDVLSGASYRIRRMDDAIVDLDKKELAEQFKPQIVELIQEVRKTGSINALDELVQLTPPGLFDMMRIKGLGGKKLAAIWHEAKIDNIDDLLHACKSGVLSKLPGFGKKTEDNIIAGIEALNESSTFFHFANVADTANQLVNVLKRELHIKEVSLCGEVRRQATVVKDIEIIAAKPMAALMKGVLKRYLHINNQKDNISDGHTSDEIPIRIYHCNKDEFWTELFIKTGVDKHVSKVLSHSNKNSGFRSEKAIYKSAGLPFIEPEMREDIAEWEYCLNPRPLVTVADIKGVVHNHTTWSDGVDDLQAFVKGCIRRGYEYAIISDHSQNAHYAGGLKPDKVLAQFEEIDKLNKKIAPFKVFKSIECDILVSGELDYDSDLLKQFDLVIISIHQLLKMNEEKATARLIKAIQNPYTTILGHMTGRQLLIRPGYPLNFRKVIDACAANGVVIEINANPYRLDMDWSHIPYAMGKGVMISINPDAHSIHEIDNIRWGVSAGRKGGLTREMTWNSKSLSEIEKWLKAK